MGTVGAVGTRVPPPPVKVTLRSGLGFSSLHLGLRRCPAWGRSGWGPNPTWSWPVGIGASLGGTRGVGALGGFLSTAHTVGREGGLGPGFKADVCPSEPEAGVCHSHTAWLGVPDSLSGPALCWGLGHSASELPLTVRGHTGVSVTRSDPEPSARLSAGLWLALPLPAG